MALPLGALAGIGQYYQQLPQQQAEQLRLQAMREQLMLRNMPPISYGPSIFGGNGPPAQPVAQSAGGGPLPPAPGQPSAPAPYRAMPSGQGIPQVSIPPRPQATGAPAAAMQMPVAGTPPAQATAAQATPAQATPEPQVPIQAAPPDWAKPTFQPVDIQGAQQRFYSNPNVRRQAIAQRDYLVQNGIPKDRAEAMVNADVARAWGMAQQNFEHQNKQYMDYQNVIQKNRAEGFKTMLDLYQHFTPESIQAAQQGKGPLVPVTKQAAGDIGLVEKYLNPNTPPEEKKILGALVGRKLKVGGTKGGQKPLTLAEKATLLKTYPEADFAQYQKTGDVRYLGKPAEKGTSARTAALATQKTLGALSEIKSELQAITALPLGNTGTIGYLGTSGGLLHALSNSAQYALNPDAADMLNTAFKGTRTFLATLASGGASQGLASVGKGFSGMNFQPGEKPYSVAFKLAELRGITESQVKMMVSSGALSDKQAKAAEDALASIRKLVPFTRQDVAAAYTQAQNKPGVIQSLESELGLGAQQAAPGTPPVAPSSGIPTGWSVSEVK